MDHRSQRILRSYLFALVAVQFLAFGSIDLFFRGVLRDGTYSYPPVVIGHVFTGALLFMFAVWGVVLRLRPAARRTALARDHQAARIARLASWPVLVILICLPPLGLAAWGLSSETAARLHGTLALLLVGALAVWLAAMFADHWAVLSNWRDRAEQRRPCEGRSA